MTYKKVIFFVFCTIFFSKNLCYSIEPLEEFDNLEVEADTVNTIKKEKLIVFKGKVIAKQDNNKLNLYSDRMNIEYDLDENNKMFITKMNVYGNVKMLKDDITISGNEGVYDMKKNILTMKNDVMLNDNISKIYGDMVVYDLQANDVQIFGREDDEEKQAVIILEDTEKAKEVYGKQK
jgi:lipopolysaccharide transport protein LptA